MFIDLRTMNIVKFVFQVYNENFLLLYENLNETFKQLLNSDIITKLHF